MSVKVDHDDLLAGIVRLSPSILTTRSRFGSTQHFFDHAVDAEIIGEDFFGPRRERRKAQTDARENAAAAVRSRLRLLSPAGVSGG